MSSLDDLIGRAKLLLSEGHSPGQIADELSLSMETVTWLLTQAKGGAATPKDVHIDWTAVSSHAPLLDGIALMLMNRYYGAQRIRSSASAEVIVGIALSGHPACDGHIGTGGRTSLPSTTLRSKTRAITRSGQSVGTLRR